MQRERQKQGPRALQAPNSDWCQPISALGFAFASAIHRPDPKLGERVSQSAARIQMGYQMSKPCEAVPCFPDFYNVLEHSHFISYP